VNPRDLTATLSAAGALPESWAAACNSDSGVPLEEISRLVGHSSTAVTELVYRKQIRPVLQRGATVMDQIFQP
jgi:integrase